MQNYSALENVIWAGAACLCPVLRTVTPQHGMAHLTPSHGWASSSHNSTAIHREMQGAQAPLSGQSNTFSGWRGLTLQTSGQGCLQAQQPGQLGGCWGLWAAGASPLPSVSPVGRHSIPKPCLTHGTMQGRLRGTPAHLQESHCDWQGDRACASPTASQQSSPRESISAHPPPSPCPVL